MNGKGGCEITWGWARADGTEQLNPVVVQVAKQGTHTHLHARLLSPEALQPYATSHRRGHSIMPKHKAVHPEIEAISKPSLEAYGGACATRSGILPTRSRI